MILNEVNSKDSMNLENFTSALRNLMGDNTDQYSEIASLLTMSDDKFQLLSPQVLQTFQKTLLSPSNRLGLALTFAETGHKAEDLLEIQVAINQEIEKLNLSNIKKDFLKDAIASLANAINESEGIAKRNIQVPIELCHPDAKIPQYAHISDSGMDVYALDEVTVKPGEIVLVPTGLKVAIPTGYELQVRPKSGRALRTKLRIANTPGTIDQGYKDEIKVIVENVDAPIQDITIDDDGKVTSILYGKSYTIGKGEKFCQLVLSETPKAVFMQVESVETMGENRANSTGESGFGSTGLK